MKDWGWARNRGAERVHKIEDCWICRIYNDWVPFYRSSATGPELKTGDLELEDRKEREDHLPASKASMTSCFSGSVHIWFWLGQRAGLREDG